MPEDWSGRYLFAVAICFLGLIFVFLVVVVPLTHSLAHSLVAPSCCLLAVTFSCKTLHVLVCFTIVLYYTVLHCNTLLVVSLSLCCHCVTVSLRHDHVFCVVVLAGADRLRVWYSRRYSFLSWRPLVSEWVREWGSEGVRLSGLWCMLQGWVIQQLWDNVVTNPLLCSVV